MLVDTCVQPKVAKICGAWEVILVLSIEEAAIDRCCVDECCMLIEGRCGRCNVIVSTIVIPMIVWMVMHPMS